MVLTSAQAQKFIVQTLDGQPSVDPQFLVNEAGRLLVNAKSWNFLQVRQASLDFIANQNFVSLPSDFVSIHALDTQQGLTTGIELVTLGELLQRRVESIQIPLYYWAAISHRDAFTPNFLGYTKDFTNALWVETGTSVASGNTTANPIDGTVDADTLTDDDGAALEFVTQTVPAHRLEATDYTFSVYLKKGTAAASSILIRTGGTTNPQVAADITWGATVTDSPTIALNTANTTDNSGISTARLTEINGGWARCSVAFTHDAFHGDGTVEVEIYPAGLTAASTGTVIAWGAQLNRGRSASEFHAVTTGQLTRAPGEMVPILEIWPTPTGDSLGALQMFYRAGWTRAVNDQDRLRIPEWMEGVYIQILRAYARAYDEEDAGSLQERLTPILAGPDFQTAARRDAAEQPEYGILRNGIGDSISESLAYYWRDRVVGGPS